MKDNLKDFVDGSIMEIYDDRVNVNLEIDGVNETTLSFKRNNNTVFPEKMFCGMPVRLTIKEGIGIFSQRPLDLEKNKELRAEIGKLMKDF
jgi:hypothetical protein